jgi:hypothetical protein
MKILALAAILLSATCAQTLGDFLDDVAPAPEGTQATAETTPLIAAIAGAGRHQSEDESRTEHDFSSGMTQGPAIIRNAVLFLETDHEHDAEVRFHGFDHAQIGRNPVGPDHAIGATLYGRGGAIEGLGPFEGWIEMTRDESAIRGSYRIEAQLTTVRGTDLRYGEFRLPAD